MAKRERNNAIISEARQKIDDLGLSGKLDIFPVENPSTRRQRYWTADDVHLFKVHMWDINSMSEADCSAELDARIKAACKYFGL